MTGYTTVTINKPFKFGDVMVDSVTVTVPSGMGTLVDVVDGALVFRGSSHANFDNVEIRFNADEPKKEQPITLPIFREVTGDELAAAIAYLQKYSVTMEEAGQRVIEFRKYWMEQG